MKKSKVDRLIKKFQAEARQQAQAETRKRIMDELTFTMAAPKDAFVIGDQPRQPFFRIALTPRRMVDFETWVNAPMHYETFRPRMVNFAAVRKSWTSGEGHTVCWYDWEFKGVSF